jgi:hypothetical protein
MSLPVTVTVEKDRDRQAAETGRVFLCFTKGEDNWSSTNVESLTLEELIQTQAVITTYLNENTE